jgi:hypothetical protein
MKLTANEMLHHHKEADAKNIAYSNPIKDANCIVV